MLIKIEQLGEGHNKTTIELDQPESYMILKQLVSILANPFADKTVPSTISLSQETITDRQDLFIIIKSFIK